MDLIIPGSRSRYLFLSYPSQEYLGSYVPDETGRLVFREGALVTAVRQGHWVVLDELNLAPSEVLEALNRCLGGRAPKGNGKNRAMGVNGRNRAVGVNGR